MANQTSVKSLLVSEIKDLYSAEKQLTKALPKMVEGSNDPVLKKAFTNHLQETEKQIARIEKISTILEVSPTGKKCSGMEGVIEEGAEAIEEKGDPTILDLGIIGAGSRVEHYEMAGYTTAIGLAERLNESEVVSLLKESLAEEQAAEKTLRQIAKTLISYASV